MSGYWQAILVLIMVLMGVGVTTVAGAPSLRVLEPNNGSVLTSPSVIVRGNASGSDGRWFQGDKTVFEAGTKDRVVVNATGKVLLDKGPSDNYDDNSINTSKWTVTKNGNVGAYEQNNALYLKGKSNQVSTWNDHVWFMSQATTSRQLQATLVSFSGTGGYVTCVFLYEDGNNYVGIGAQCGPEFGDSKIHILISAHINGVQDYGAHGITDGSSHTYKISYINGVAELYQDDALIYTISITLTTPKVLYTCGARDFGDTVEAVWDDLVTGYVDGALTSSVYDTRSTPPVLTFADWNASSPTNTNVVIEMRSSDRADMALPTSWASVMQNQTDGFPAAKRYLQYQAKLSTLDGIETPALMNVTFVFFKDVMKVEARVNSDPTWHLASGTRSWQIALYISENDSIIWVKATDVAGDVNITSINVVVDTTPPEGSVQINDGNLYTPSENITLALNATDRYGVSSMLIGMLPNLADGTWVGYCQTKTWTFSSGDGLRTVYARFRDAHGLLSSIVSDSIVLDTTPPTGSVVINGGAAFTNNPSVSLRLHGADQNGVRDMMVSEDPLFQGARWLSYVESMDLRLSNGDGNKTVYTRFRDAAGLVSTTASATIILDTRPPDLVLMINNGSLFTNARPVSIALTSAHVGPLTTMQVSEDPDFLGAPIESYKTKLGWVLSVGEGSKTIYAHAWDAAGNLGPVASVIIILDTTPPILKLAINGGATYTNSTLVEIGLTSVEENGVEVMMLSEDQALTGAISQPFATATSLSLSAGDGKKDVYARARDFAGNLGPIASASIILDTTSPKLTLTIEGGARSTRSLDIGLALDASDPSGVRMMRLSEDPALVGAISSAFAKATRWTLSTGDGEKVVYASAADGAGNWGAIASDSIVLDTTPPFSTIVAIPPQGTSLKAAISWNATDKLSGVAKYDVEYREGKGPWMPWQDGTCSTAATFVGEYGRSYDFRARAVDGLGNTEPFPEVEARFAHVVFPELPWFLVRTNYIWLIVIIVVAASVGYGFYMWRRRT